MRTVANILLEAPILHASALAPMRLDTRLALAAAVQRAFLPVLLGGVA